MATQDMNEKRTQQGSGSAENTGGSREDQKHTMTRLNDEQRINIAEEADVRPSEIADLEQTGALSGRDDAAGGPGDNMEDTDTNDPTDKF